MLRRFIIRSNNNNSKTTTIQMLRLSLRKMNSNITCRSMLLSNNATIAVVQWNCDLFMNNWTKPAVVPPAIRSVMVFFHLFTICLIILIKCRIIVLFSFQLLLGLAPTASLTVSSTTPAATGLRVTSSSSSSSSSRSKGKLLGGSGANINQPHHPHAAFRF